MVHIIDITWGRPFQQHGDFKEFRKKHPDLDQIGNYISVWRDGVNAKPLSDDQVPKRIEISELKKTSELPDSFRVREGLNIVSNELKSLIEEFDPGLHQFFPVEISLPAGREPETRYYIIIVTESKATIIPEMSKVSGPRHGKNYSIPVSETKTVFSSECQTGANIWREEGFRGRLFISDEIDQEIKARHLKFYKRWKGEIAD